MDNLLMSDIEKITPLAERALELAQNGEVDKIEDNWLELNDSPPTSVEFYNQFVRALIKSKAPEKANSLTLMLLDELANRSQWETLMPIVESLAGTLPDSPQFRHLASRVLKGLYGGTPNFSPMVQACKGLPLDQALKRFKVYLQLFPGQVYAHATLGVGVIQSLDLRAGKAVIDFDSEKGRTFTLQGIRQFLTYLPPEHFLAKAMTDPDQLLSLAEDDPLALVRLMLQSFKGRLKQSDFKSLLLSNVLPESRWTSWWNRVRTILRSDPYIDFDPRRGAHSEIALRSKPKTVQEEVEDLFFSREATLADRIAAIQSLKKAADQEPLAPELQDRMLKVLNAEFQMLPETNLAERIQIALLSQDIQALGTQLDPSADPITPGKQLLQNVQDYGFLADVDNYEYAYRALQYLIERDNDQGITRAAELLPKASVRLAQAIWRELEQEHHADLAVQTLQRVFQQPLENPETYLWAVKSVAEGGWEHLEDFFPVSWLVPELLEQLEAWEKLYGRPAVDKDTQAAAKLLMSRVRSILQANHFAPLCNAVENMPLDQVQRVRKGVLNNPAFNEVYRAAADRQLVLTRRDLETATAAAASAASSTSSAAAPSESTLHYCTERARELKLRELRELNTVIIPANAQEIEKARAEGDLKENAGYIYAREKHKLLMQQSLRLQQDLATARVYKASAVKTDTIGFGVAFDAENMKNGRTEHFTVLGRFETDPDHNVLSYQSPFMEQFIGKTVGDQLTVKHPGGGETPYRIISITNALESEEWSTIPEA